MSIDNIKTSSVVKTTFGLRDAVVVRHSGDLAEFFHLTAKCKADPVVMKRSELEDLAAVISKALEIK